MSCYRVVVQLSLSDNPLVLQGEAWRQQLLALLPTHHTLRRLDG